MNQGKHTFSDYGLYTKDIVFIHVLTNIMVIIDRTFTCWEQFIVMAFAQLTYRESLKRHRKCLRSDAK